MIFLINIYCSQFGGCSVEEKPPLRHISDSTVQCTTVIVLYSFKWQHMAGAGTGAEDK